MKAPAQYRRQPMKVQAIQYTADNQSDVCMFIGENFIVIEDRVKMFSERRVDIANISDWIVKEGKRSAYVVDNDEFLRTHGK